MGITLRGLLESGRPTVGGWCRIPSPISTEIIARAGFDWVCVDMQHGLAGQDSMVVMLQALDACAVPGIIRVPWNDPASIMRALDAGAQGVVVPMINSVDDAERAAQASKYPPIGFRSWGPARASLTRANYSISVANESTLCMAMIETRQAVENVDAILGVDGIDGAYVGPSDLAISCGLEPHEGDASESIAEMIQHVLKTCRRLGLVAGVHCPTVDAARARAQEGFRMMAVANDAALLSRVSAAVVAEFSAENGAHG